MKPQQLLGANDDSPLHAYLKVVDSFMGDHDWSYVSKMPREDLLVIAMSKLGSFRGEITDKNLNDIEEFFKQHKESVLLEIVQKLRRTDEIDLHGIRVVLYWLIANIDLLAERYFEEGKHNRQLNDDWQPAW